MFDGCEFDAPPSSPPTATAAEPERKWILNANDVMIMWRTQIVIDMTKYDHHICIVCIQDSKKIITIIWP